MDKANLIKIVRLPDNVFREAKVETIIIIFKKKDASKLRKTDILIYDREDRISIINKETARQTLSTTQDLWGKDESYVFNIYSNDEIVNLIKKIEKDTDRDFFMSAFVI